MTIIGSVIACLIVIGFSAYFLIKASNELDKEHTKVEDLVIKNDLLDMQIKRLKSEKREAASKISSALVELNSMGPQEGNNATFLKTAQHILMEAYKIIEN